MHKLFKELKKQPAKQSGHVRILDCIVPECIETQLPITNKKELFNYIAKSLSLHINDISADKIEAALWKREQTKNTSVGHGLALPHARVETAKNTKLGFFITAEPIDYGTTANKKINIFIATLGPPHENHIHLELLAAIASLVEETTMLKQLSNAQTSQDALNIIKKCISSQNGI